MTYIVERIIKEEGLVLLEQDDRSQIAVPLTSFLKQLVCEGDVVEKLPTGYAVNHLKTKERRDLMIRRTNALFGE